jgi:ribosomal protein S24E
VSTPTRLGECGQRGHAGREQRGRGGPLAYPWICIPCEGGLEREQQTANTHVTGFGLTGFLSRSDVLHPQRPNVSKNDLRDKLALLYKTPKDSVSVFGFRTQFGGGKSTGFALLYDSEEALKKFEPHYRLVRYDLAKKIEKPSRQQRKLNTTFPSPASSGARAPPPPPLPFNDGC